MRYIQTTKVPPFPQPDDTPCTCVRTDADEIDFDGFLRMLRVPLSSDDLDQYESRHIESHSYHGGTLYSSQLSELPTVTEDTTLQMRE